MKATDIHRPGLDIPAADRPMVELANVTKTFRSKGGPVTAVAGIDLSISPGEVVAFLGPNGAGKTTTLDMILGLNEPTSGTIQVLGDSPRRAVLNGVVSAVLQTGGLLADLTVVETVRLIASTYREHAPVEDVLERTGLTSLARRRVSKCSGGEQQRLRFALALLPEPDLLILDEPTAGMDVGARREFWAAMHDEASRDKTVIFATHYLEEASNFAERIVMISAGRIVADGPTEQIRATAAGRSLTVDLDGADLRSARQRLDAHPAVTRIEQVNGTPTRLRVHSTDSDTIARLLLTELGGHDLEISTGSLDDAFLALTTTPTGGTR